jgi:hypothetical protein
MKRLLLFAILLASARVGWAQRINPVAAGLTSASTTCTANDCAVLNLQAGDATAGITLAGTFSGTVTFEASAGGQQWQALSCQPWTGGAFASTATATGGWECDVAGKTNLRARFSSYTSGTAVVSLFSGTARGNGVTSSVVKTQVDQYTSAGVYTWTKPTGAIAVQIVAIGGGGAGGAGIVSTAAGGGGGGGGGCAIVYLNPASLGATLQVTVGTGGIGGSTKAAAGDSTIVDNGTGGSGKTILTAGHGVIGIDASSNSGGGGGGGGSGIGLTVAANGNPGTQGSGQVGAGGGTGATTGAIGGAADQGGGGGGGGKNATGGAAGGTSVCGGGGGGGGASTGTAGAGGVGGQGAAGGTSQGGSATSTNIFTLGGSGGAGGAQTTQTGGAGAKPGGGGGGGGNLATSGGNGADGSVVIISYF